MLRVWVTAKVSALLKCMPSRPPKTETISSHGLVDLEGDLDGVRVGRGSVTRAAYGDERLHQLHGMAREYGCGCGRESAGVAITALYMPSHSLRAQRRNHDLVIKGYKEHCKLRKKRLACPSNCSYSCDGPDGRALDGLRRVMSVPSTIGHGYGNCTTDPFVPYCTVTVPAQDIFRMNILFFFLSQYL